MKANPAPRVLELVYSAGTRHFETASLPEIELVRGRYADVISADCGRDRSSEDMLGPREAEILSVGV